MNSFEEYERKLNECQDCEPKVTDIELEYEGKGIEPSKTAIYNCYDCENKECEYWKEYNESEE